SNAGGSVNSVKLVFGDIVCGEQRRVAGQIALCPIIGGLLGSHVGLRDLEIGGCGLLELNLGTCIIGCVGFLLSSGAAGIVGSGFARQGDLQLRGIGFFLPANQGVPIL